jgi:hypothetical protein
MGFIVFLILNIVNFLGVPQLIANSLSASQLILIDRSGSMRPYYQIGVTKDIATKIFNVCRVEGETGLAVFSSNVIAIPNLNDSRFDYERGASFTLLDRAIEFAIKGKYDLTWVVTDNIQDEPWAPQVYNTEVFYQQLRGDEVKKVVIFPILQPQGRCGLVIYGILLSKKDAIFEKELLMVQEVLRPSYQTEALRMKPLDTHTIEMVVLEGKVTKSSRKISEGQVLVDSLDVRFKSKFDHLKIIDALITEPQIQPEPEPGSILLPEKMEWTITPKTITTLDPFEETQQIYKVYLNLGKIRLKKDIASLWTAAFSKSHEKFAVNLSFFLKVEEGNFRFKDSFLRNYNAQTMAEAKRTGKIYALSNLPILLGAGTYPILTETRLFYDFARPWWPAFLFIIIFLVGAAVIAGVAFGIYKTIINFLPKTKWNVRAETTQGLELSCDSQPDGTVIVDGDNIGEIRRNRFFPSELITPVREYKEDEESRGDFPLYEGAKYRFKKYEQELRLIFNKKEMNEESSEAVEQKEDYEDYDVEER